MVSEEPQSKEAPRFEVALERLEAILEAMEGGAVPLDSLVDKYEEGVDLLKACHARLREAELKIEAVKRNKGGLETELFEPEANENS